MASLLQFSRNIRKRGSQIKNSSARAVKSVTLSTLKSLVLATPVDKGVLRSNWRVGVGAPATAQIGAYAPGEKLGRGERANASATINAGRARIQGAKSSASVGRFSVALYISNNVPYIDKRNVETRQNSPYWIEDAIAQGAVLRNFRVFGAGGSGDDGDEE